MRADAAVQQIVTFRIAKEEFAFPMEHVREILRVQTPNQVPDVPEYVLGVLTVRGNILPVIDLCKLLQQRSLAEEFVDLCRPLREEYSRSINESEASFTANAYSRIDSSITERLRKWLGETNSSSQSLMEALAKARGFNERVVNNCRAAPRATSVATKKPLKPPARKRSPPAAKPSLPCGASKSKSPRTSRRTSASSWWMPMALYSAW